MRNSATIAARELYAFIVHRVLFVCVARSIGGVLVAACDHQTLRPIRMRIFACARLLDRRVCVCVHVVVRMEFVDIFCAHCFHRI